jgi:hypothetical protein
MLQERLIALEEEREVEQEGSPARSSPARNQAAAQVFTSLSSSSHWAARQMGAIEGCMARLGVGELAELFSFVWVAAATSNEVTTQSIQPLRSCPTFAHPP